MTVGAEGSSERQLGGGGDDDGVGSVAETCASDWVTCPVCGNTVRGEDYMINSHLGLYLLQIFVWIHFLYYCFVHGTRLQLLAHCTCQEYFYANYL